MIIQKNDYFCNAFLVHCSDLSSACSGKIPKHVHLRASFIILTCGTNAFDCIVQQSIAEKFLNGGYLTALEDDDYYRLSVISVNSAKAALEKIKEHGIPAFFICNELGPEILDIVRKNPDTDFFYIFNGDKIPNQTYYPFNKYSNIKTFLLNTPTGDIAAAFVHSLAKKGFIDIRSENKGA